MLWGCDGKEFTGILYPEKLPKKKTVSVKWAYDKFLCFKKQFMLTKKTDAL